MLNSNPNQTERILVVRDQQLVPLLSSRQDLPATNQPWSGVLLEQHLVTPGEIPEHHHPDLCLHLQTAGSEDFEWWSAGKNAVEHTRPGSLILLPPGTTDRLQWKGRSQRLILSVRPERLLAIAESAGVTRAPEFLTKWAFHDPALQNLIAEMRGQAQSTWRLGGLYADLLVLGLGTRLLRAYAVNPLTFPPQRGGLSLLKLRRAMEYINANLAEDIRLETIAKELEMSASHLAHEFRSSTGKTPYQYLLDRRMTKAKDLLKGTEWPVQYISGLVGFSSPVNFVRTFRQRVGSSPAAWRKSV